MKNRDLCQSYLFFKVSTMAISVEDNLNSLFYPSSSDDLFDSLIGPDVFGSIVGDSDLRSLLSGGSSDSSLSPSDSFQGML